VHLIHNQHRKAAAMESRFPILIASQAPDFIIAMQILLEAGGIQVYVASSDAEVCRLHEGGVVFEAFVIDPWTWDGIALDGDA
jgi:hypothetical protein